MSELIDNRAHRIRTLKEIIQQLHRGTPADEVRDSLRTLVRETSSTEIAAMEQELIAGGMPVEEAVVRIGLETQYCCIADPAGWDPLWGKSPVHFAGDVHSAALKRALRKRSEDN